TVPWRATTRAASCRKQEAVPTPCFRAKPKKPCAIGGHPRRLSQALERLSSRTHVLRKTSATRQRVRAGDLLAEQVANRSGWEQGNSPARFGEKTNGVHASATV